MDKLIPIERIERQILLIRGKKVMLDEDLAELYQVPTHRLNEQVKRNVERFPGDFMFQLTAGEYKNILQHRLKVNLISQIAISSWGGRRKTPLVFTEQGVAMLSSVLKSKKAIFVNVAIMRAFVRLRHFILSNKKMVGRLNRVEIKVKKHDEAIESVFGAIRQLMAPPDKTKRRIGFVVDDEA